MAPPVGAIVASPDDKPGARDLAESNKGNTEAQTDLVVGLYKLAKLASGERKLTDDQKGWSESFLSLRTDGSQ